MIPSTNYIHTQNVSTCEYLYIYVYTQYIFYLCGSHPVGVLELVSLLFYMYLPILVCFYDEIYIHIALFLPISMILIFTTGGG